MKTAHSAARPMRILTLTPLAATRRGAAGLSHGRRRALERWQPHDVDRFGRRRGGVDSARFARGGASRRTFRARGSLGTAAVGRKPARFDHANARTAARANFTRRGLIDGDLSAGQRGGASASCGSSCSGRRSTAGRYATAAEVKRTAGLGGRAGRSRNRRRSRWHRAFGARIDRCSRCARRSGCRGRGANRLPRCAVVDGGAPRRWIIERRFHARSRRRHGRVPGVAAGRPRLAAQGRKQQGDRQ